jgi:zinc protease
VLADIVQNASFPADEVERQRKRSLDSLGIAMKDPGALALMAVQPGRLWRSALWLARGRAP